MGRIWFERVCFWYPWLESLTCRVEDLNLFFCLCDRNYFGYMCVMGQVWFEPVTCFLHGRINFGYMMWLMWHTRVNVDLFNSKLFLFNNITRINMGRTRKYVLQPWCTCTCMFIHVGLHVHHLKLHVHLMLKDFLVFTHMYWISMPQLLIADYMVIQ